MSRGRASSKLLGIVALSSVGSVALALAFGRNRKVPPPSSDPSAPVPSQPAPVVPAAADAVAAAAAAAQSASQATSDFDRGIVAGLDGTVPGTLESYDLLRRWALSDTAKVMATLKRYQTTYG